MNKLPQNCINKYEKRFGNFPSVIELQVESFEKIEKLISKSLLVWFSSFYENEQLKYKEKLVEYDASGIYIYIIFDYNINKHFVTFLTSIDRKQVCEYTIKQLMK